MAKHPKLKQALDHGHTTMAKIGLEATTSQQFPVSLPKSYQTTTLFLSLFRSLHGKDRRCCALTP